MGLLQELKERKSETSVKILDEAMDILLDLRCMEGRRSEAASNAVVFKNKFPELAKKNLSRANRYNVFLEELKKRYELKLMEGINQIKKI